MATYKFKCRCGNTVELEFPISDAPLNVLCEKCLFILGTPTFMARVITAPNIHFKGGGFYCNDSKPDGGY